MSPPSAALGAHAIVIGASFSGALAARVLSDHFERVTLVERDRLGDGFQPRKGVPQGVHVHAVLARLSANLEAFFPGILGELVAAGAQVADFGHEIQAFRGTARLPAMDSDLRTLHLTRVLLEGQVRRRALALPNVQCLQGVAVSDLVASPERRRILGVRLQAAENAGPCPQEIPETLQGDLVVDTSGRGSRSPQWLQALGYPAVAEDSIKIGIGYTSALYRLAPGQLKDWKGVWVMPVPPRQLRGGVMGVVEGERLLVTLYGYSGEHAPTDPAGFVAWAATLASPQIHEFIRQLEPASAPAFIKVPASVRRAYGTMASFPQRYLLLGDALCGFNPVYGQGLCVSSMETVELDRCLRRQRGGLGEKFAAEVFSSVDRVLDAAWQMSGAGDLHIPGVEGKSTPKIRFVNWFAGRYQDAMLHHADMYRDFARVLHMTAPAGLLFKPAHVWRALRGR